MGHPPLVRRLSLGFLAVSLLVSLALLSVRNLYDDEHTNFDYLGLPLGQVVDFANHADVHPPGQYVLTNLAFRLIPSARWETLFPLALLYLGLGLFVWRITPLFSTWRQQSLFLLLATLHPQLLMWGNTARWYSWWTGLALITIVVALQPAAKDEDGLPLLPVPRAAAIGVLLAALFYLNYITLLFLFALLVAMIQRYQLRAWWRMALMLAIFAALVAPQLHPMLAVHMHGTHRQEGSPLSAALHLAVGLLQSEAYLPWHWLAIAILPVYAWLLIAAIRDVDRRDRARLFQRGMWAPHVLATLGVLFFVFAALLCNSGLGVKARSGLVLVPLTATLFAAWLARIRPTRRQTWVLAIFAVWSLGGIVHLLTRSGLAKASMIDHPDELIRAVRQQEAASAAVPCTLFVTYDTPLALALVTARLPDSEILDTHQYALFQDAPRLPSECPDGVTVYWLRTYFDDTKPDNRRTWQQMADAAARLPSAGPDERFSHDPDAAMKRRLARFTGVANLPDDRIVVTRSLLPLSDVPALERSLPDFVPADGHTPVP